MSNETSVPGPALEGVDQSSEDKAGLLSLPDELLWRILQPLPYYYRGFEEYRTYVPLVCRRFRNVLFLQGALSMLLAILL
jgi:hypothetical protein